MLQRRKKKRSGITINCATTYEDKTPTQRVVFHSLVIGATGRLSNIKKEVNSVIEDTKVTDSIAREMQKTVVVYTQQMIHRILTGLL